MITVAGEAVGVHAGVEGAGSLGAGELGAGELGAGSLGAGELGAGSLGAGELGAGALLLWLGSGAGLAAIVVGPDSLRTLSPASSEPVSRLTVWLSPADQSAVLLAEVG